MRVLELLNMIEKTPEIKVSVLYIDISDDIYLRMQDSANYEIKLIWEEIADDASLRMALQLVSDVLRGPYVRGRRSILVQLEPAPHVTCGVGFYPQRTSRAHCDTWRPERALPLRRRHLPD